MSAIRVAVTASEYKKSVAVFEAAAASGLECISVPDDEAGLVAAIKESGAKHAIVGVVSYKSALYETIQRGCVLARYGVGHDGIDKAQCTAKGIFATNTPGALDDSVAEHVAALLLSINRHVPQLAQDVKEGRFGPRIGVELRGRTIAVIGCGPIGRRVARCFAFGFGMKVIGCEVMDVDVEALKRDFGFAEIVKEWTVAVRDADYVSLHIPSIPATKHFLNAERIAQMPKKAIVINTARGAIVDEVALYDALTAGVIAGAALDVFEVEPYVPRAADKDLRTLNNVLLTPHVSSSTVEACTRMATFALNNIHAAERKDYNALTLVNPDVKAQFTA